MALSYGMNTSFLESVFISQSAQVLATQAVVAAFFYRSVVLQFRSEQKLHGKLYKAKSMLSEWVSTCAEKTGAEGLVSRVS